MAADLEGLFERGEDGQQAFGQRATTGKWDFSTNGTYWAGKAGIPAVRIGRLIRFLSEPIERMAAGRISA